MIERLFEFIKFTISNDLFIGIFSGLIVIILVNVAKTYYIKYRYRDVARFWKNFSGKNLTVIFSEYPPSGEDKLSKIAKQAGGKLMTKGMALALATIMDFFQKHLNKKNNILYIRGDKSGNISSTDIIILGSQASNHYAKTFYEELSRRFDIPYWVDTEKLEIHFQSDKFPLKPKIVDGNGLDYAIVLKATMNESPQRNVLFIGGCLMYGTHAATLAVTDPRILSDVIAKTKNEENISFLLRTTIVNEDFFNSSLDIENDKRYINCLKPRTSKDQN